MAFASLVFVVEQYFHSTEGYEKKSHILEALQGILPKMHRIPKSRLDNDSWIEIRKEILYVHSMYAMMRKRRENGRRSQMGTEKDLHD